MCHIVTATVLTRLVTALVYDGIVMLRYTALVVRNPTRRAVLPAEYCGFGIIPCVDHLSLVHASHGTMKEQVPLSMDIVIHGLKPQYLD